MCLYMGSCVCHSVTDYVFVSLVDVTSLVLSLTYLLPSPSSAKCFFFLLVNSK